MKKTQMSTVFLAVAICIVCLVFVFSKAHAETISSGTFGDNLTWVLDDTGTLTISGIGDMPAGSAPWLSQQERIKTIIIDDGITSIPEDAFDASFNKYQNLTKVTIADSVTSIGASAFSQCKQLTDIKLSANLTAIANNTFNSCSRLTEIVIPNGVTTIGRSAFYSCYGLTNITIPSTLTYVDRGAFTSCSRISNVYISDITAWMNIKFNDDYTSPLLSARKTLYLNNEPVTALVIPDGTTEIDAHRFQGWNFTSVTIPDSVTIIHNGAFRSCWNLTNVVIPNQVTQIGSGAFMNCEKLASVTIGEKVTSIENSAFKDCTQLQQIVIPNSVTNVGNFAFEYCTNLVSVTIGTGVSQIGTYAFSGCSSLTTITIPGSVSTINERTFENCTALTSVTFGEGVTAIEEYAFWRCHNLNHISFSDSITVIRKNAFEECYGLQNLVFGQGLQVIEQEAFSRCRNIVTVDFQDNLTAIGRKAFYLSMNYNIIILPASIQTIDAGAFYSVWHVLFKGTESQWNSIKFDIADLNGVQHKTVHFNCTGSEVQSQVFAPTCTEYGYTALNCSRCKAYHQIQIRDATGHSFGSWYIAKEATFVSTGIERRDCKNCNQHETKDIPVKTHIDNNNDSICDDCGSKFCINHAEQVLPGQSETCSQDGLTDGKKCANCEVILQAQEVIPATGHSYGEWSQVTSSTTEVLEKRVCALCGEKEQRRTEASTPGSSPETTGTLPTAQPGTTPSGSVPSNEEGTPNETDLVVIILIVAAVVAVVGGVAIVLIKKK